MLCMTVLMRLCMALMTARTQHIAIMDWLFGHGLSVTLNHKITLLSACVVMYAPISDLIGYSTCRPYSTFQHYVYEI